jgi:uncharacterized protein (DUF433 family)
MATSVIDIDKLLDVDPYNGKPVIRGSRLRVETLVARHLEGQSPSEIAGSYPDLKLPAVYAALAYYYEHKAEMDDEHERDLREALIEADTHGIEII